MDSKKKKIRNILFITQGGINTASTRFRVLSFIDKFNENGVATKVLQLPPGKQRIRRLLFLLNIFLNAPKHQIIFIQKVLLPIWILHILKILNKHIVYDWDDALYSPPPSDIFTTKKIKSNKYKLKHGLPIYELVICGNQNLERYTHKFNNKTTVIPTSVDEKQFTHPKKRNDEFFYIGWTGKSENLIYLNQLRDVFIKLEKQYRGKVRIKIVSDKPLYIDGVNIIDNIEWRLENEVTDIESFDIGIMPLSDDEWTRGKCAFKLLQYMAAGVPCIGSPVGANSEVITHNHNGLLASTIEEWSQSLEELINQPEKRETLAQNAIGDIKNNYSKAVIFHRLFTALEQRH